jgi:hypothetical protein
MRCLAMLVVLLSAGAAGAAWYSQQSSSDWQAACSALEYERDRSRQLDCQLERRHAFASFCEMQLFDVLVGKKRLVHACRAIESYAALHWPPFLEQVGMLLEGRTLREKLAYNLANSFAIRRAENGAWEREPMFAIRMIGELSEAVSVP